MDQRLFEEYLRSRRLMLAKQSSERSELFYRQREEAEALLDVWWPRFNPESYAAAVEAGKQRPGPDVAVPGAEVSLDELLGG